MCTSGACGGTTTITSAYLHHEDNANGDDIEPKGRWCKEEVQQQQQAWAGREEEEEEEEEDKKKGQEEEPNQYLAQKLFSS